MSFQFALKLVATTIVQMRYNHRVLSGQISRNMWLMFNKGDFITRWSIFQCTIIIASAMLQVFALRKLFNVKGTTGTNKPRA